MSVVSVEKIDGKIYVKGDGETVFEYKKDCSFQKKNYLNGVHHLQRKGLLGAIQNNTRDSVIVLKKNKALWSCPLGKKNVAGIRVLDQSKLVIGCSGERNLGDTLWLLDDKCRWTLFETNAELDPYGFVAGCVVFPGEIGSNSRFFTYNVGRRTPYIVAFDSSWNRHWGTSPSFWGGAMTRDVACSYEYSTNPDDTDPNGWVVKCVRWTGNNFVEFTLPYEYDMPECEDENNPVLGILFPCGDGICVQDRETKKIEVLVDE